MLGNRSGLADTIIEGDVPVGSVPGTNPIAFGTVDPSGYIRRLSGSVSGAISVADYNTDTFQAEYTTDASGNEYALYEGFAPAGTADGTALWVIYKYTYSAKYSVTKRQVAVGATWTGRASASYG